MLRSYKVSYVIFWLAVIFYTDPGGFWVYYVGIKLFGLIPPSIFYTSIAFGCFMVDYNKDSQILRNRNVRTYVKYGILWLSYYLIVFIWFNNQTPEAGLKIATRVSMMVTPMMLVIPIIYYSTRSLDLFMYLYIRISILILLLFLVSVVTGVDIMPTKSLSRNFTDVTRRYMWGFGVLYLLIPMALANLLTPFKKIPYILFAGLLTIVTIILTIARRHITGLFETYLIVVIVVNYIKGNSIWTLIRAALNVRVLLFVSAIVITLLFVFPDYIQSTMDTIDNVVGQFAEDEEDKDQRLSFTDQKTITGLIQRNTWLGTGYNYLWYTSDGNDIGMEGADYMFLSSVAMYGVIGLLFFLPIYFLIIRTIIRFAVLVKRNRREILGNYTFLIPFIVFIATSNDLIKNLIEYPNWFAPIWDPYYFVILGLLIGSLVSVENKLNEEKK